MIACIQSYFRLKFLSTSSAAFKLRLPDEQTNGQILNAIQIAHKCGRKSKHNCRFFNSSWDEHIPWRDTTLKQSGRAMNFGGFQMDFAQLKLHRASESWFDAAACTVTVLHCHAFSYHHFNFIVTEILTWIEWRLKQRYHNINGTHMCVEKWTEYRNDLRQKKTRFGNFSL